MCPFACEKVVGDECTTFVFDRVKGQCSVGKVVSNSTANYVNSKVHDGDFVMINQNKLIRNATIGTLLTLVDYCMCNFSSSFDTTWRPCD